MCICGCGGGGGDAGRCGCGQVRWERERTIFRDPSVQDALDLAFTTHFHILACTSHAHTYTDKKHTDQSTVVAPSEHRTTQSTRPLPHTPAPPPLAFNRLSFDDAVERIAECESIIVVEAPIRRRDRIGLECDVRCERHELE